MSGVLGMRHTQPRRVDHHRPRLAGDLMLATRVGTAALINRHPSELSRHATPIACDTATRLNLYDVTAVEAIFAAKRRRVA